MNYILALDQGTTSSRAILFDRDGASVAIAQREFRQIFPRQGWVEHDPNEIWVSQRDVARQAIEDARVHARDIAAIGITNQRETVVLWDRKTGEPIANAIVWQDRRTASDCDELKSRGLEAGVSERTGLLLDPYFSATKVRWMLDNIEGARERAERGELCCGTIDSWLVFKLTGGRSHVTDSSNASRTSLFNIDECRWDDHLIELFGVPQAILPTVVSSSSVVAETDPSIFGAAIKIGGLAGDQQAALFGQRCVRPGMVKNTYGTGCFVLMNTGSARVSSAHRLLKTIAWSKTAQTDYALEGSVFIGGAIVQWLRDGLGIITSSNDVEALAMSVPDNGGVYLVPALAGLGAPHWDPYARGAILGLTRGATKAHIARAALESIAYQSADLIDAMRGASGIPITEVRVDGGAARNDMLMQFQADLLGVPVVRPCVTETTALGAAYHAGLAVGFFDSADQLDAHWRIDRTFEPGMPESRAVHLRGEWARAVERAKRWASE